MKLLYLIGDMMASRSIEVDVVGEYQGQSVLRPTATEPPDHNHSYTGVNYDGWNDDVVRLLGRWSVCIPTAVEVVPYHASSHLHLHRSPPPHHDGHVYVMFSIITTYTYQHHP